MWDNAEEGTYQWKQDREGRGRQVQHLVLTRDSHLPWLGRENVDTRLPATVPGAGGASVGGTHSTRGQQRCPCETQLRGDQ